MTRDELIRVKIGDLLYNKVNNNIVEMTSGFVDWKITEGVKDDEYISAKDYGHPHNSFSSVRVGDYDQWEHCSEDMPDSIKLKILSEKFFRLEQFVYQRLR